MSGGHDADRLDRLEARAAIADLVHEYARLIRRDRPENVSALFAPEGRFEIRDGHPDSDSFTVREILESPQALHDYLAPTKGKPHPVPVIHNLMIEVAGDSATANALMEARIYGTPHTVSGEYHDSFRRVDGRWLFASRVFTLHGAGVSA